MKIYSHFSFNASNIHTKKLEQGQQVRNLTGFKRAATEAEFLQGIEKRSAIQRLHKSIGKTTSLCIKIEIIQGFYHLENTM